MGLNSDIPKSSKLAITGGIFKSRLNDPTAGKYDFTNYKEGGTRYNVAIDMGLKMHPNYVYFFHEMNFSLSCDESSFLAAIKAGTVPTLSARDSQSRKAIFKAPFRIIHFFQNSAIDSYYYNQNGNNNLLADFQCVLSQTADFVGVDYLYGQVSMSVYEITDEAFIKSIKNK